MPMVQHTLSMNTDYNLDTPTKAVQKAVQTVTLIIQKSG